jgi:hypothetical protein
VPPDVGTAPSGASQGNAGCIRPDPSRRRAAPKHTLNGV